MGLILLYLSLALAVSFLCSILEAVLLSTPLSFIKMKEREGAAGAPLFKELKTRIDRPISAILSLNTVAHTVGAAGVGAEAVKVFGEAYFGIISAALTVLILVLSEILPKTIGARYWRSMAMGAGPVIQALIYLTYPLVVLSDLITKIFSSQKHQTIVSREEVAAMVTVGAEEGVIGIKESRIIQNLFSLEHTKACEIMTPASKVAGADETLSLKKFCKDAKYRSHSCPPLYMGNRKGITCCVLRKVALEEFASGNVTSTLGAVMRPALSINWTNSVSSVWERMLENHEHIALLTDEHGNFRGIVTLEDIMETVLGFKIMDEKEHAAGADPHQKNQWEHTPSGTGMN